MKNTTLAILLIAFAAFLGGCDPGVSPKTECENKLNKLYELRKKYKDAGGVEPGSWQFQHYEDQQKEYRDKCAPTHP